MSSVLFRIKYKNLLFKFPERKDKFTKSDFLGNQILTKSEILKMFFSLFWVLRNRIFLRNRILTKSDILYYWMNFFYHILRIEKSIVKRFGILSQNLRWIELDQSATRHNHDFIIVGNCIQPMCDGQQCGWFEFFTENSLNRFVGFTIYTCSRFREDLNFL